MPVGWTVGIAAFLLLCVGLIYVFFHWSDAKKPFLIGIVGSLLLMAGGFI